MLDCGILCLVRGLVLLLVVMNCVGFHDGISAVRFLNWITFCY